MGNATTHRLKRIRLDLDLTQREMADVIGCAESTIRRLEGDAFAKTRFAPLLNGLSVHYEARKDAIKARVKAGEPLVRVFMSECGA